LDVKILVTLEDYTSGKEHKIAKILESALNNAGIKAEVEFDREKPLKRLMVKFEGDLLRALEVLRGIPEVSRLIPIFYERLPPSIELATLKSIEALRKLIGRYGSGTFKIEVKKIDDASFRIGESSVELCRIIGFEISRNLALRVDVKDPDYVVYIQFGSSGMAIGVSLGRFYRKFRKHLPSNFFQKYVIVFEKPKTAYEIMDMLRLCAALNVELRIVGARRDKVDKALRAIGGVADQVKLKIYDNLIEALKDLYPIGFSVSASLNEEDFLKVAFSREDKLGILIGNEFEGLSIEARHAAKGLFRLGPRTQFSMRSSTAAAYILGLLASVKLTRRK